LLPFFFGIFSFQAGYIFWIAYLVRFSGYLTLVVKLHGFS
jgi:hypothetical protein